MPAFLQTGPDKKHSEQTEQTSLTLALNHSCVSFQISSDVMLSDDDVMMAYPDGRSCSVYVNATENPAQKHLWHFHLTGFLERSRFRLSRLMLIGESLFKTKLSMSYIGHTDNNSHNPYKSFHEKNVKYQFIRTNRTNLVYSVDYYMQTPYHNYGTIKFGTSMYRWFNSWLCAIITPRDWVAGNRWQEVLLAPTRGNYDRIMINKSPDSVLLLRVLYNGTMDLELRGRTMKFTAPYFSYFAWTTVYK